MKRIKITIITSTIILLTLIFSLNSEVVTSSIKFSIKLCYNSVIPSLFPFFILCEFLMLTIGGAFTNTTLMAFSTSLITGFPTGIKNVCSLYENRDIDKTTAVSLLHCTANASPAYIVSFIGGCILKDRTSGLILLISQFFCALSCSVFFGCFKIRNQKRRVSGVINVTDADCKSISDSVISCIYVCGYITFFGLIADIFIDIGIPDIIARLLFFLPSNAVKSVSIGFIEITRGLMMTESDNIVIAAIITSFSGISVIMQCINCTIKSRLPSVPVISGKIAYTLVMPVMAVFLEKLIPKSHAPHETTYSPFVSFVIFILFISFCIILIYNIFDKSSKRIYNK